MTRKRELIDVAAISELLSLSVANTENLLVNGAIPSVLKGGHRFATRAAVLEWRSRREHRRRTLAELAQLAQNAEGMARRLRRPERRYR